MKKGKNEARYTKQACRLKDTRNGTWVHTVVGSMVESYATDLEGAMVFTKDVTELLQANPWLKKVSGLG